VTVPADVVAVAVRLSRGLPRADVAALAVALLTPHGLAHLCNGAGVQVRAACGELQAPGLDERGRHLAAGVLLGSLAPDPTRSSAQPVWTGPITGDTARLTSATIVDLIGSATTSVLLVGYAVHSEPTVTDALLAARARGVAVTLVLERAADNPGFHGSNTAFPGLDATRLCWPSPPRPGGASLHAKALVIDEDAVLVGSANITGAALGTNLECGLLVRGGSTARSIRQHISGLVERHELRRAR